MLDFGNLVNIQGVSWLATPVGKIEKGTTIRNLVLILSFFFALQIYTSAGLAETKTGVIVPLYSYVGGTWDELIEAKNLYPSVPIVAIINPSNGPGYARDANYDGGIQKLRTAGITVLGYVSTNYGSRSTASIKSDIDQYKNWYSIDGIFFDEMTNWVGMENHYSNLDDYAELKGYTFTVGNPGTDVPSSYIGTVDNIVIYENFGLPSISFLGGWHSNYDKKNFAILPFGIGSIDETFVKNAKESIGLIYITHDSLPNPWDSLSSSFLNLLSVLNTVESPPPVSTEITLAVKSVDLSGNSISGLWTEIYEEGELVKTGFTSISYTAVSGKQYKICMGDYNVFVFDHWETSNSDRCRTITPTQDQTLTAFYQTGETITPETFTLTVKSSYLNKSKSLWATIESDNVIVAKGYTPLTYKAATEKEYEITVLDNRSFVFDHWGDGSTSKFKIIKPTADTEITAYFKKLINITVRSKNLDSVLINGLYTTISDSVNGNLLMSGFTTFSYDGVAGENYMVCVANYQNYIFQYWGDGTTKNCVNIKPSGNKLMTAYYKT